METPKPHPHADLIKAWADGATIQVKIYRKQEAPTWVDIENPTWSECDEYRIKPEANEPWKPKLGDEYYAIYISFGEIELARNKWNNDSIDNRRYSNGICFKTKEEAEAAAERVKAALKGELKISAPNTENFQLDGKPLTDGEKALIRALRSLEIYRVMEMPIVVYRDREGNLLCGSEFVVFDTYATGDDQNEIIAALNQIRAEQEASND